MSDVLVLRKQSEVVIVRTDPPTQIIQNNPVSQIVIQRDGIQGPRGPRGFPGTGGGGGTVDGDYGDVIVTGAGGPNELWSVPELDLKANITDLALKADITYVDSELAAKADTTYVDAELAKKADVSDLDNLADVDDVNAALALKADITYVDAGLATKANDAEVDAALALKADISYVDTQLAGKASQGALDAGLATKADTVAVNAALDLKADEATTNAALAAKADITFVTTSLDGKADISGDTFTGPVLAPGNPYGPSWNGSFKLATENDIYDKIQSLEIGAGGGGVSDGNKGDVIVSDSGTVWEVPELDLKADITDLNLKADTSFVTSQLALKADLTYVDAELAEKVDTTTANAALALKADSAYVNTELNKKAVLVGGNIFSGVQQFQDPIAVPTHVFGDDWAGLVSVPTKGDLYTKINNLESAIVGALKYQGVWDANANIPALPAPLPSNKGWYWKVSVAGSTTLPGGINTWSVGDWAVSNGSTYDRVANTETVLSVNGKIGTVVLNKADIGLGNVDNISDLNKPISIDTQAALDLKAPLAHTHTIANITGLQLELDGKAPTSHTHGIDQVVGLQDELDDKADVGHTHIIAEVTGLQAELDDIQTDLAGKQPVGSYAPLVHNHAMSDITGLQIALDDKAPLVHIHGIADVSGLQAALDSKQPAGSYAAVTHTHIIGDVTGLQSALDGKAALVHNHDIDQIIGLQTALDSKQPTGNYSLVGHSHVIADVTGLQGALDGKQPVGSYAPLVHTHVIADTTGLQAALDAKQPIGDYAPLVHSHAISDITGLTAALAGKAPTVHTHAISDVTDLQFLLDSKLDDSQLGQPLGAASLGADGKVLPAQLPVVPPTGVTAFNTRTGDVTLISGDVTTALGFTPVSDAVFTPTVKGLAPASGGGSTAFLRADGVWAVPPGGGGGGEAEWGSITGVMSAQADLMNALNAKFDVTGGIITGDVAVSKGSPALTINPTSGNSVFNMRATSGGSDGLTVTVTSANAVRFQADTLTFTNRANATSYATLGSAGFNLLNGNLQVGGVNVALVGHTHAIGDVSGLQAALDGKQAAGSYAPLVHTHVITDTTGLQAALDSKQPTGNYSLVGHSHVINDITNLQTTLDAKVDIGGDTLTGKLICANPTAAAANFNVGYGTAPSAGNQVNGDIWSTSAGLFYRANGAQAQVATVASLSGYALLSGANFTSLQVGGVNVSLVGHSHVINDVTGLQAALDGKQAAGSYAPLVHSHSINDTTGLQAALDSKQPTGNYSTVGHVHADVVAAGASGFMTGADKTKLDGIATGATANATDAQLRDRSTHTGTQGVGTLNLVNTARVVGRLSAGSGIGEELTFAQVKSNLSLTATDVGLGLVDNVPDANKSVASAAKLTTARTINGVSFDGTANITINAVDSTARIAVSEKGAANGVCPLDAGQKIASTYLPAYVDDVQEYANYASLPVTGMAGIIYITLDNDRQYRWSGSTYIQITSSPGSTDAVPEGSVNLYFTENRVRATVLTGLNVGLTGAISASDSVLTAFGRLQNSLTAKANVNGQVFTGAISATNLSGTNTGDQTSIVGITGTLAQFNTAITDADVMSTTTAITASQLPAFSGGDVTGSAGSAVLTIGAGRVTLAMQANMATGSVVYRKTAGSGAPEVQSLATLKTDLGLTGTNSGDQTSIVGITGTIAQFNTACTDADFATGGGTATGTNTGDQTTITGNAGTATALQNSRNFSISGGGITAAPVAFNGTGQVVLNASVDAGHITLARMANLTANSIIGNNTGSAAVPLALTAAQVSAMLPNFTSVAAGHAPASGGGTVNFLRADGTWAAPPGGAPSDTAFGAGWDGSTTTAPSQNAVYDEMIKKPNLIGPNTYTAGPHTYDLGGAHKFKAGGTNEGWVYLQQSNAYPEVHIRPNAGKYGAISFTEDTVADRWAIGIKPADGNFYFTPGGLITGTAKTWILPAGGLYSGGFATFYDGVDPVTVLNGGVTVAYSAHRLYSYDTLTASLLAGPAGFYIDSNTIHIRSIAGGSDRITVDANATFAIPVLTPASIAGAAGLRLPHGTAPSSPTNGDMWTTTAGLYVRVNGTTVGPLGSGGGAGDPGFTVTASGTGSSQNVTLPSAVSAASDVYVFVNGLYQYPVTDYSVSGTTLTITTLNSGDSILISKPAGNQGAPGVDGNDGNDGVNALLGFTGGIDGVLADAEKIIIGFAATAMTLTQASCMFWALTGATASSTLTIKKKTSVGGAATTVGTAVFAAGGQAGAQAATVTITDASVGAGDFIYMDGPATADATLSNIGYMIRA